MKKIILCLLLIWQFTTAFSQDWAPVRVNDTVYYYRNDNPEKQFIYGVSVDSTHTTVDSVGNLTQTHFFASSIFSEAYPSFPYVFYPVFATPKVHVSDNQKDWKFVNTAQQLQYHIKTGYPVGTTWMYDISMQIEAEITGYSTSVIGTFPGSLTTTDSVMNVQLSDSGKLVISQHYGLIYAESQGVIYRFLGIKNQPIGKKLPTIEDVFAFHVGDSLQYETYEHTGANVRMTTLTTTQLKVTDIYQQNDSLFFIMKGRSQSENFPGTSYNPNVNTAIVVSLDSIPGQEMLETEPFHYIGIPNSDSIFYHSLSGAKWKNNHIYRYLMAFPSPYDNKQEWSERLGEVNNVAYSYGGVRVVSKSLTAYLLANGEAMGEFVNIVMDTTSTPIIPPPTKIIDVYPNPCNKTLTIHTDARIFGIVMDIYDSQGKVVHHEETNYAPSWNHVTTRDVSTLPSGLYYIKINGIILEKLVIYR